MTADEIAVHAEKMHDRLDRLVADELGLHNYKEQLKGYQLIMGDSLVLIRELARLVESALTPPTINIPKSES